jgi:hypothetical protein
MIRSYVFIVPVRNFITRGGRPQPFREFAPHIGDPPRAFMNHRGYLTSDLHCDVHATPDPACLTRFIQENSMVCILVRYV